MPRSGWRSNVAVVGWLIVGLLNGYVSDGVAQTPDSSRIAHGTPSVKSQSSGNANDAQNAPEEFSIPVWNVGTSDEAQHTKEREATADKHDADDLKAQRDAAQAARISAQQARKQTRLTLFQTIIAVVGTFGLIYTLILTRRSLTETRRSVSATISANEHQREVSAIELRPYLFCNQFIMSPSANHTEPTVVTGWLLEIDWKNFGKTPAARVRANVNVDVFALGETPEGIEFRDVQDVWPHGQTLAPEQSLFSRRQVSLADLERAWRGEVRVIYWGWIEYDGRVVGSRHRTEICAELQPQGNPSVIQTHFKNAWLTAFNAADGNCLHDPKT